MNQKTEINPITLANTIMMSRPIFQGSYLILEGETDYRLFENFTNNDECLIKFFRGSTKKENYKSNKTKVLETMEILDERGFEGALAIIDADYEHILGYCYESGNVIRTETCDIESLMIKSEALDKLLREKTDLHKVKDFQKSKKIRDILVSGSKLIGYFRLIALKNKWEIRFRNLDFSKFICSDEMKIDFDKFLESLAQNSPNFKLTVNDLRNKFKEEMKCNYDSWLICNGHDCINILLIGYLRIFGKFIFRIIERKKIKTIDSNDLESRLRSNFEFRFFRKTKLYKLIRKWEINNNKFVLLTNS